MRKAIECPRRSAAGPDKSAAMRRRLTVLDVDPALVNAGARRYRRGRSILRRSPVSRHGVLVAAVLLGSSTADAQPFDPSLFQELRWRCIGPHRGGRTVSAEGVPSQPNVFYIRVNNGG